VIVNFSNFINVYEGFFIQILKLYPCERILFFVTIDSRLNNIYGGRGGSSKGQGAAVPSEFYKIVFLGNTFDSLPL
jgi:hypothetical protein